MMTRTIQVRRDQLIRMVTHEEKLVDHIADLRGQSEKAGRHLECYDNRGSGVGVVRLRSIPMCCCLMLITMKKARMNHIHL